MSAVLRSLQNRRVFLAFGLVVLLAMVCAVTSFAQAVPNDGPFRRIATFPVFLNTDIDTETVAEIVTASEDGQLLIYSDGENGAVGFVDIADPASPQADGMVVVGGEPTSVSVAGNYVLASVNTSADFINTSGSLQVIDIATRQIVATLDLGGQPDAIDVSPDRRYAAVAIENERDEDLGDGAPPQAPGGFVVIVDLVGNPTNWTTRQVDLTNVPNLFPGDPEPEYLDINEANIAAVSMQENNHIALIDLASGTVVGDFNAGTVTLNQVDDNENDLIEPIATLTNVPREPDGLTWTSLNTLATADEGDLDGGSRGFTLFGSGGNVVFNPGNRLEHLVMRLGHYPEGRSENKGNEPENVAFGTYGTQDYLFVGSERSSVVFVYVLSNDGPRLLQVLPTGFEPEGLLTLPARDLFVAASETDDRGDKVRSSLIIYQRIEGGSNYPKVASDFRADGTPIPWAALSALTTAPGDDSMAYAVHDSFYQQARIYGMDISSSPAVITSEIVLNDATGVLAAALAQLQGSLPGAGDFDPAALVNGDGTVNIDPEGLALRSAGGFWVASEGSGNLDNGVSDPDNRPFASPNMILGVEADGDIVEAIFPPADVTANQLRFGFEGVSASPDGQYLYVAFQRAWGNTGDPSDRARIGRYDTTTGAWDFAYYPLDEPTSGNGGWVGLSEITYVGPDTFAVIERDNQGGPDAAIKRIYSFSVAGVNFLPNLQAPNFSVLTKTLVTDLMTSGAFTPIAGAVLEKWEGMAALSDGTVLLVNDNDGVDDSNGETQLLRLQNLVNGGGGGVNDVEPFVCVETETTACLNGGRFQVTGTFSGFGGEEGDARIANAGTSDSGLLYFFDPVVWEILVKVIDGCSENDRFWVFAAATTNVEYELTVTDSYTGRVQTYENNLGAAAVSVNDIEAFATCP